MIGEAITTDPPIATELKKFTPIDSAIAAMRTEFMPLVIRDVTDLAGYKAVHAARMVVKSHRVQVEKVRKELKADALEYGRRVDGEAKRITGLLEPIESHLATEEDRHEAEKDRIKNAERLAAEAAAKAAADEEAARIKAEQEAESERLRIEREKLAAEQERIEADRRAIEVERQRLADIEAARQKEIENERIRKEAAEHSRIETEERIAREAAKVKADAVVAEAAKMRAEALRPDREKLLSVAVSVDAIVVPTVSTEAAKMASRIAGLLRDTAVSIRNIASEME